jgi:arsenate reductase
LVLESVTIEPQIMTVRSKAEIWHNPACSKSRETLALLKGTSRELTVIEYLKSPPTAERIDAVLTELGVEPRALMRTKEPEYASLHLDDPKLSRKKLIAAMVAHPKLIERPVVITERGAVIARPPELAKKVL